MDLEELYQDVVLDHSRRPRNYGELPDAQVHVHGDNPMCGDEVTVHLKIGADDTVEALRFTGNGCSICMASASLMTLKTKAKPAAEAARLASSFVGLLTAPEAPAPDPALGDLQLLAGVRKFPQRVKCATLPWHALEQALQAAKQGEAERNFSESNE